MLLDCFPCASSESQADLQKATAEKRTSPFSRSVNCLQILAESLKEKQGLDDWDTLAVEALGKSVAPPSPHREITNSTS